MFVIVLLVLLILFSLLLMGATVYFMRRTPSNQRDYFKAAIVSLIFAIIPAVASLLFGLGREPANSPHNFLPFTYMFQLFFIPAGGISLALGIFEAGEARKAAQKRGAAPSTTTNTTVYRGDGA